MKKTQLLHPDISYLIATLGHGDQITIADAGLPIPDTVTRIDLALVPGIPSFLQTVAAVLQELHCQQVVLAKEFKQLSSPMHDDLIALLSLHTNTTPSSLSLAYVDHEHFKEQALKSRAVIRTGEFTPYANLIFISGVVF